MEWKWKQSWSKSFIRPTKNDLRMDTFGSFIIFIYFHQTKKYQFRVALPDRGHPNCLFSISALHSNVWFTAATVTWARWFLLRVKPIRQKNFPTNPSLRTYVCRNFSEVQAIPGLFLTAIVGEHLALPEDITHFHPFVNPRTWQATYLLQSSTDQSNFTFWSQFWNKNHRYLVPTPISPLALFSSLA